MSSLIDKLCGDTRNVDGGLLQGNFVTLFPLSLILLMSIKIRT
jgi:hypothetical protein